MGGEAVLLGEPLAALARRAEPHLCSAALRVLEAALASAQLEPLAGGDELVDGMNLEDIAVDERALDMVQKVIRITLLCL